MLNSFSINVPLHSRDFHASNANKAESACGKFCYKIGLGNFSENTVLFVADCGNNVSSTSYGVISSPNYPSNYDGPKGGQASKTCNWYITVRPTHRILLNMETFAVEGEPSGKQKLFLIPLNLI